MGNEDTNYKKYLFDLINSNMPEIEKVSAVSFELNDKFQFEFIKQGEEESRLNTMFIKI
jgi:hypothetical protein